METREASRKLEEFAALAVRAARATEAAAKSGSRAAVERATKLSREKVALGNQIVAAMTERSKEKCLETSTLRHWTPGAA